MEDDQSKIIYDNITNFKNKDERFVLNSIQQMEKIVEALGPERTLWELLPYLRDLLEENEVVVSSLLEALLRLPLDLSTLG